VRYLEAGAADELNPIAAPEACDLRLVVASESTPCSGRRGDVGRRGPHGGVGGEERRRLHRHGSHGLALSSQINRRGNIFTWPVPFLANKGVTDAPLAVHHGYQRTRLSNTIIRPLVFHNWETLLSHAAYVAVGTQAHFSIYRQSF
jgi:hypothetical protein